MPDLWEPPTIVRVYPVRRWGYHLLLGQLVLHIALAWLWSAAVWSQSQDLINERQTYAIQTMDARVTRTEREIAALQPLALEVGVLKEVVAEQKWLIRGVTLAVVGQLVILIVGGRLSRPE